jgi:3-phenylpropionate/trans-cinnamate dioxygenase ferredoxin subunit
METARAMATHVIGLVSEVPPGGRKVVDVDGRSIGIFNIGGTFYALRNACPHQGGPVCEGRLIGLTSAKAPNVLEYSRPGEIIRCPWHGWEFDVTNGRSIFNPHRVRVRSYEVTIERDEDDSALDTYRVTVERSKIVLHI